MKFNFAYTDYLYLTK